MRRYQHTRPLHPRSHAATVVVHCADPRYQPHFHDFLRRHLKLDRYALVAVPGGPHLLVRRAGAARAFSQAGWAWMKFLLRLMRPRRMVLIAHDDCRWYIEGQRGQDPAGARRQMLADIRRVAAELRRRLPRGARVESYLARLTGKRATLEGL